MKENEAATVEEALGISDTRFAHLGFIMDDLFSKRISKAEMISSLANNKDLSEVEKVYMGVKAYERLVRRKFRTIPFAGPILLKEMP